MPPFSASSTPAASRPKPATLGLRPIANITSSVAMTSPSLSAQRVTPESFSTAATVRPVTMRMPCFPISARRCARTSSSKPRRMFSPR